MRRALSTALSEGALRDWLALPSYTTSWERTKMFQVAVPNAVLRERKSLAKSTGQLVISSSR